MSLVIAKTLLKQMSYDSVPAVSQELLGFPWFFESLDWGWFACLCFSMISVFEIREATLAAQGATGTDFFEGPIGAYMTMVATIVLTFEETKHFCWPIWGPHASHEEDDGDMGHDDDAHSDHEEEIEW